MTGQLRLRLASFVQRFAASAALLLLMAAVLAPQRAQATHAMGGELTYECIGNDLYLVTLNFYRDCNGVAAPTNGNNGLDFRIRSQACNANFTQNFTFSSVQIITPICSFETDRCTSTSGQYGVERYTYTSTVNLSAFANCNDWIISWDLCCRNNAITSLNQPGGQELYLEAQLNNTVNPCNTSPEFLTMPTPFYCVNQPLSYNPGAVDADGDSLAFQLVNAKGVNGGNLAYNPGYTFTQPIRNGGGAGAVVLDPQTGTLTCIPNQLQVSVVTYRVNEYRNGVLIGSITRDIQFVIRSCTGQPPTASGVNGGGNYSVEVCAGTPVSFTITSNDPDGDNTFLTWNNGIPGATFTATGAPFQTGTFNWTPTNANIGQNFFTVTVQDNGCPLVGTNDYGFTVIVTPPNTPVDAGPDQNVCATSATLAATLPYSQAPHNWSVISGTGTFANAGDPNTVVSGLSIGANVFQWNVNYQTCGTATDQVTITRYDNTQPAANAGPDQQLCLPTNSTTLAANAAIAPAVGTWTVIQGTGTFANANSPTSGVSNLGIGTNRFRWTINNGPCGNPQDDVIITVFDNTQPIANAGPDIQLCTPTSTATMQGSAVTFPATGLWTLSGGVGGTITTATSPSTTITGLPVGVHTYTWTVSNGPCGAPTTDQVTITVFDANSPNANAGADQQICATTTSLTGSVPTAPASGVWSVVQGGGAITNATSPITGVTGLTVGTNIFQWTVNNGPCANGVTSDQVTVVVFDPNSPVANAGPDQEICNQITTATMAASVPTAPATGTWSVQNGGGTITNPNSPTTTITNLPVGENIFVWTVTNGPCPGSTTTDEVTVWVYDENAPVANAGPDQEICTPTNSVSVSGNAPIFPQTGQWTLVSGSGTITNANSPATTITGLPVGVHVFAWTLDNGVCSNPVTVDEITITVYDLSTPIANAGPDQEICTPASTTTLQGSALIFPATGQWTLISGTAVIDDPNDPNTQISGLSVGTVVLEWTVDNGPCTASPTTDQVTIEIFDAANPAADAGPDQDICTPTNSVTMAASAVTAPAVGTWVLISGAGGTVADVNDPNTDITNLPIGVHVYEWQVDNGSCFGANTDDQVTISVFAGHQAVAGAGPDQEICIPTFPNTVTLAGTPVIFPGTGTWTLVSGSGNITDPNDPNTTVTGLTVGTSVFQWTVTNGPTCANPLTTDQMSVFVFDQGNPVANAGPDFQLCTPLTSAQLSGSALNGPATGQWTVQSGTGVFADPTDPNTTVSGISLGPNEYVWTVSNGPCVNPITSDVVVVTLFNGNSQQAAAGPDQSFCTPTSSTIMNATPVFAPATGSWSLISGGGNIANNNPNASISNLPVGINVFQWTVNNGACGNTTDLVSILIYDANNPIANAGADQELCTPTTQTTLTGSSLIVPATGLWTLVSGSGNIVSPTASSTLVNSLGIGDNVFVWTVTNGPCANSITTDTVVVSVFDHTADEADAGPDRTLCSPLPFIVMQGNAATAPGVGTWTTVVGTGIANDPNSPTTIISGISVGDNIYVWTIDNGACGTSSDSTLLVLHNGNLPVADAGPDQELCLPTTNTTLAGSPAPYPATGLWSLISGTGAISNNTISNPTVSGLSLGINQFEWVVFNAPCANAITRDTVTIIVFDPNEPAADAGDDQDLCTPLTTTNLAGNTPTFPAVGFWTTSSGATIADPANPNTQVSGLAIGENIFTWTIDNGSCNGGVPTTDQVSIFVFDENNPIAAAGPDQELCLPTTSAQLSASSYTFPATGQWTIQQGQGIFSDDTDPNATVTGLAVGENIFVWTVNNGPCANPITTDAVSIFLFDDQQADASAGPDQNLCTPNINATMAGNAITAPAIGTWTLVSGAGTITDANDPTTVISNLGIGENVFAWTIDNGPCANGITSDTVHIFLYDETNANADAGPDQEICTPQSSVTLAGSPVTFPAVGTWTVVSGTAFLADVNDPLTICTGLGVGEVILEWTVNNGPCGVPTTDQVSIFIFDEFSASADAGPDQELCTPTSTTTLQGSVPTFPSTGTWTLIGGSGIPVDPSDPNTVVNGLAVGENIFEWTVDNGPCANGTTTDQVSIFVFDENNPVADAGPDQDLCTPNNFTTLAGSNVIFPAMGTWTLIGGTATITNANDPGTTITAIGVGTATLVWTVNNGPCASGITTDTVNITLYDGGMPDADAGPDQQVCDDAPQATMAGSAVIAPGTGVWTLASGGGTIVDATDPNTLITGMPVGENIFVWSVSNGPCAQPTSDAVSIFVFDDGNLDANAGPDQQVCTPITSANLSGSAVTFPATGLWVLINGTGIFTDPNDPNTTVTNLGIGNNEFQWVVNNGPCANGLTTDNVIIQLFDLNQPPAAAGPDQELCTPNTTATMAGNTPAGVAAGTWTAVGAGSFTDVNDPTTDVSGLIVGENVLVWTIDNGICGISSDSISVFVFDEFNPAANAGPDVEQCTPNDSIVMAGNTPTFPAIGTWSLIQGAGLFADVNDPNTLVVGMAEGYNTFVWTVDNGPCPNGITTDTMTVILFPDSTPAPVTGPDVEICLPQNTANITATVPPLPFTGFWTIVSGSGTITDSLAANTTVTGLTLGVTTLLWTIDNGPCPDNIFNSDTLLISVFDPSAPPADAGPDQELCTPTDSTVMQGNSAVFPGYGTWSLVGGTGVIADVNDPNSTVTGLSVGQNIFVWEIYNGNCGLGPNITRDTVSVFVFDDAAQDATAGPDQEFCTPTSTSNLSANSAVFPGFGSWTTTSATAQIGAVADPNSPVSNLTVGTHTFIWTIDNGPCPNGLTSDTLVIEIYDGDADAADAGPDQEICIPTFPNQVIMAANVPVAPATGFWTLISGTGVFTNPGSPNTEVTGMSIGTNVFEWSIANGPCGTTTSQVTVTVFDAAQPDAAAGPDQEICTPTSSVTMAGNTATFPATSAWTIISGSGNITSPTSPTTTVTGLQPGVTTLVWTIDNGPCANGITTDTMTVTVFDNTLTQADAGDDQDFCSPVTSVTLDANQPPLPATGQWTVVSGSGTFTDASSASTDVTGLDLGANVFEWTVSNGPCGTTTDQVTITIYDSNIDPADAGESFTQCQHQSTSINLNAVPATSTGTGVWTLVSGTGTIVDASDPTTLVTDLQQGTNVFAWTISNGPCPASTDTMIVEQEDCLTLIIPDAFSPNRDGVNDTYVIDGLQFYPNNSIKVFNRWGNIVLERSPYNNDWDGRSENSMNWGEELPESTYYMILDLGNGDEPYTGYIYLKR
ncbi:MAG: gliding motility-associated C-terminal domain-containing protein [Flavobacteriales bacterium]|nr:MAG: gliding motility-associated C-terminal domain-containing protein [Flavobacteriales bacterium]